MANDITVPGTGEVLAFDDVGSKKYQRIIPVFGLAGAAKVDTSATNPLPITMVSGTATLVTGGTTGTLTQVNDSASSGTLLASDGTRKGWVIWNDSTEDLFIAFASAATLAACTAMIPAGERLSDGGVGVYQGIITGIWRNNSTGAARMTSWT